MYKNHLIYAITPAGRKEYLEILEPYILKNRSILDKWIIWVNTPHESDIQYICGIHSRNPDFIELVFPSKPLVKGKSRPQPPYFVTAAKPGVIYVKFDDDIVWIAPDAIETLVRYRCENPRPFFVMANTIMNGYCAYIHQKRGAQSFFINGEYQRISPDCLNKVWSDPRYAEYVHRTFIADLLTNDVDKYKFDSWTLDAYQRVAINCITWSGDDFAVFGGVIPHFDEEDWLCTIKAKELGRPNEICGNALVAHYAFYKHRQPFVQGKPIDHRILRAYRLIQKGEDIKSIQRILNAKTMM